MHFHQTWLGDPAGNPCGCFEGFVCTCAYMRKSARVIAISLCVSIWNSLSFLYDGPPLRNQLARAAIIDCTTCCDDCVSVLHIIVF
jgi:hypothetical protein